MILIVTTFVLITGGMYLLFQRSVVRAIFRLGLLSHAVNLVLFTTGVLGWWMEPITDGTNTVTVADPLPQTFVLIVTVITLAMNILMLAMAVIGHSDNMPRHPEAGEAHRA